MWLLYIDKAQDKYTVQLYMLSIVSPCNCTLYMYIITSHFSKFMILGETSGWQRRSITFSRNRFKSHGIYQVKQVIVAVPPKICVLRKTLLFLYSSRISCLPSCFYFGWFLGFCLCLRHWQWSKRWTKITMYKQKYDQRRTERVQF